MRAGSLDHLVGKCEHIFRTVRKVGFGHLLTSEGKINIAVIPKAEGLMAADDHLMRLAITLTACGLSQAINQSIGGSTGLISSMSFEVCFKLSHCRKVFGELPYRSRPDHQHEHVRPWPPFF